MKKADVLHLSSIPLSSPSYPSLPFRFVDREYMIIGYRTDPERIRAIVPEPLQPDPENIVYFEWIKMPDSSGFGSYTESGVVIPCHYKDQAFNYVSIMFLDDLAPIVAGREIWGFPKKYGHPKLEVYEDTLVGTLEYSGERVATGTMTYKNEGFSRDWEKTVQALSKLQVNLKIVPGPDGKQQVCQLVGYNLTEINLKGSWNGEARLHLIPHVHAPVADLPVHEIVSGRHIIADLTLPAGFILYDYLKD